MHLNTGIVQERDPYSEIGSEFGILCAGLCFINTVMCDACSPN